MAKEFQRMALNRGNKQSYLGMNSEISSHKMFYMEQLLLRFPGMKESTSPAVTKCFPLNQLSELLHIRGFQGAPSMGGLISASPYPRFNTEPKLALKRDFFPSASKIGVESPNTHQAPLKHFGSAILKG